MMNQLKSRIMTGNIFDIIYEKLDRHENILLEILQKLTDDKLDDKPKIIKINEAVRITGYSKKYIYNLISKNEIPFIKKGKSIRFEFHELIQWVRAGNGKTLLNNKLKTYE